MRFHRIKHSFVEYVPDELDDGILYISISYTTATHKCFCGCGWEVTTPIAPNAWELIYNGQYVSLNPSVGSRNLKCRSHYWIRRNRVDWFSPFVDAGTGRFEDPTKQKDPDPGFVKRILRKLGITRSR